MDASAQTRTGSDTTPSLLVRLVEQLMALVRTESALARAEFAEKFRRLAAAGMSLAVAIAFLIAGMVVLLQACVMLVASFGVDPLWATAIVAAAALALGFILLATALSSLRNLDPTPTRALRQVREDAALAKEHAR